MALANGLGDAQLADSAGVRACPQLQDPKKFLAALLPFIEGARS